MLPYPTVPCPALRGCDETAVYDMMYDTLRRADVSFTALNSQALQEGLTPTLTMYDTLTCI